MPLKLALLYLVLYCGHAIGILKRAHAMNSQLPPQSGKPSDFPPAGSASNINSSSAPNRYQFEATSSIRDQSPGSIQRSANLNVRALRRSQSDLTISSRQRLIDPEQFASQNPWSSQQELYSVTGIYSDGSKEKSRKSISAPSLAAVKRFLRRDFTPLPRIIDEDVHVQLHSTLDYGPNHVQPMSNLQDFSSSFTPTEIIIQPQKTHHRLALVMKPESPLSIGGGFIHGEVAVMVLGIKGNLQSPPVAIGYLSVDLVGVESCNRRHHVFQSLAVDLIDRVHPPPAQASPSISPSADGYWELASSLFTLPFQLQLSEDPGPPPFLSRHGSIKYLLSATAIIRSGPEETYVRDSCQIYVLCPHNPRVSLVNLPQPLNATDTFVLSRGLPFQDITVRASLNRDVWASGMSIFVDVHVRNRSLKHVNKVTLSLERVMMVYNHPIAQVDPRFYRQSRLPDKIYRKTVASKSTSKSKTGWRGISPQSRESKTWMLDLPTGLATINTGRYFGVRFFLKVSLHLALIGKTLEAQLPVTILDPNSLDITSEFEPLPFTSSRPRPSTINSDLPLPSLRGPYGRRIEHKTPEQRLSSRQRRETWAWVTEVSPHPSLVPSPLLPSFGIPSKSGKTPSRLRVENRLSTPPVPSLPERLRPPLEEKPQHVLNRRDENHTSDYPLNSTDVTKHGIRSENDTGRAQAIGVSTLASLREQVKGPRKAFGMNTSEYQASGANKGRRWLGDQALTQQAPSLHPQIPKAKESTVRFNETKQQGQFRSPLRIRKPVPHRRAISRSKDVRSVYRPLSKDTGRDRLTTPGLKNEADNGWETVENFF